MNPPAIPCNAAGGIDWERRHLGGENTNRRAFEARRTLWRAAVSTAMVGRLVERAVGAST